MRVEDLIHAVIADNPGLDLEGYGAQLLALFERATRPDHGRMSGAGHDR